MKKIKKLLEKYKKKQIIYGKPLSYLLLRNNVTKAEIETGLFDFKNLEFCEIQKKKNEIRYVLYFVYSNRKGGLCNQTYKRKIENYYSLSHRKKNFAKI